MSMTRDTPMPDTSPIPVIVQRGRKDVRATLAVRSFRWVFLSMLVGSIGAWVSRIALDWLILELTGSVAAVGLAVTFQFAPILLFGLWGGSLSDRFPRLRVIRIANGTAAAGVVALAVLAQCDALMLWHIYGAAALGGLAAVAEGPARSALIAQVVPRERLQTAIGINAAAFHTASLGGVSASGAVLILFGAPWALTISAVLAVLSFAALTGLRTAEIPRLVRLPELGTGVAAAARYAWRKPGIRWPLVLLTFVATFGMTQNVLFAAAARDVGFGTGPGGYSLYMAAGAFGALLGAILSTRRRTVGVAIVVTGAVLFGAAMVGAAFAQVDAVFVLCVVVLSLLRVMFATSAEALVQLSTNPAIRGRVSGLYLVIVAAGQTGGAVLIGAIVQTWGLQAGFAVAGGVPFLAGCVVLVLTVRTWDVWVRRFGLRPRRRAREVS